MDINKKIEECEGFYWMDLADPEEAEYVLEWLGGRELLEGQFPRMYQAYCRSVENAKKKNGVKMQSKVSVNADTSFVKSKTGMKFEGGISGFLCDTAIETKDIGVIPPRPWKNVSVMLNIEDADDPSRPPFASVTRVYKNVNQFCGTVSTKAEVDEITVAKTNMRMVTEFQGIDQDGCLRMGFSSDNYENHLKGEGVRIVERVILDDPKYKNGSNNNPIIMLYGREASQNPDYKNADYVNGEYKDNNGGAAGDGKLKTLMPIKGTIVFKNGFRFVGLAKPNARRKMYRPTISLNKSQVVKYYQDEWPKDNPDEKMYNAIKDSFQADAKAPNVCNFDLRIDGSVDWKADLEGTGRYIKDNARVLDYEVDAAFLLEVWDGESKQLVTLIVRYTDDPAVDLYAAYDGDGTVYIPAVRVYWGCMAKDSRIWTAGGKKPVSEIRSGEKVMTVDGEYATVAQVLKAKEEKIYRIRTDKGAIGLTGGHPVLLRSGEERNACSLRKGDALQMRGGETAEVLEVSLEEYQDDVYNLLIQEKTEGAFLFANGFAVGDTDSQNRPLKAAPVNYTEEELKLQEEFERLCTYRNGNG